MEGGDVLAPGRAGSTTCPTGGGRCDIQRGYCGLPQWRGVEAGVVPDGGNGRVSCSSL